MYWWNKFQNTINYYLAGKGSLIKLIIIWWFILNTLSFFIGLFMIFSIGKLFSSKILVLALIGWLLSLLEFVLAVSIIVIYPCIFILSLWRCSAHLTPYLKVMARLLIAPFLICHGYLSVFYGAGAVLLAHIIVPI